VQNQPLNLILTLILNNTPLSATEIRVNIQLNIVTHRTYPDKFIRDNVVAPFVPTLIAVVTLHAEVH